MSAELKQVTHIDNVRLGEDEKSVVIIDQTQLPGRTVYRTLRSFRSGAPRPSASALLTASMPWPANGKSKTPPPLPRNSTAKKSI